MLQDEGNRIISDFLKSVLKYVARYTAKFAKDRSKKVVKKTAKTIKEEIENHEKNDLKTLLKKHPGVHVEEGIAVKDLEKMKKALQKLKIDFVVEPNLKDKDKNKYNIIVPSGHRQTVEYLHKKIKAPDTNKESLDSRLARARAAAEAHNQKITQQKKLANVLEQEPIRHKGPRH